MRVLFWMFIGFDRHATSEHLLLADIEQLCKAGHSVHIDMAAEFPSEIYRDEDALLQALRSLDTAAASARTAAFSKQFMEYGGSATQACVKALFEKNWGQSYESINLYGRRV